MEEKRGYMKWIDEDGKRHKVLVEEDVEEDEEFI
jgi:hypothetical protein